MQLGLALIFVPKVPVGIVENYRVCRSPGCRRDLLIKSVAIRPVSVRHRIWLLPILMLTNGTQRPDWRSDVVQLIFC